MLLAAYKTNFAAHHARQVRILWGCVQSPGCHLTPRVQHRCLAQCTFLQLERMQFS